MLRLAVAALLACSACGEARRAASPIAPAALRAHVAVLADDAMAGRRPGTPGGAMAEAYIERAFRRAGLKPGTAQGWRQAVPLVSRAPGEVSARFEGRAGDVTLGPVDVRLTGAAPRQRLAGPVLTVGEAGPLPPAGAIVILPADLGPARLKALQATRPAAILDALSEAEWASLNRLGSQPRLSLADSRDVPPRGSLSPAGYARVKALAPTTATLDIVTVVTPVSAANILGRVPGRDPAAGAVILTAHWDHLGLCRPEGAADRICNGANDNAVGVAMLIEIGRRLAAGPRPVRDVYLVATTAEESGLLGARALAKASPVPLRRVVAALNLDSDAIAPRGAPVAIIGRGRTPALDAVIDRVATELGRASDRDGDEAVMLERQDGWALAEAGVPAVMAGGGFSDMKALMAYLGTVYHRPDDDLAHLPPLDGAAEDAELQVALVRALADPAIYKGK